MVSPIADAPEDGSTPLWWWAAPIAALAALLLVSTWAWPRRHRARRGAVGAAGRPVPGCSVRGGRSATGSATWACRMRRPRTVREVPADFLAPSGCPPQPAERVSGRAGALVNEATAMPTPTAWLGARPAAWRILHRCSSMRCAAPAWPEKRRTRMVLRCPPRTVVRDAAGGGGERNGRGHDAGNGAAVDGGTAGAVLRAENARGQAIWRPAR
ncbi:hypothetical protein ACU686_05620 [Yinghuangia aomiensis]